MFVPLSFQPVKTYVVLDRTVDVSIVLSNVMTVEMVEVVLPGKTFSCPVLGIEVLPIEPRL